MVARVFFSISFLFIFYFCRRDNVRGPRTATLQHNSKTVWPEYCLCLPQRLQDGSGRSAERLRQRCVDGPTSSTLFRSDRSPSFVYFFYSLILTRHQNEVVAGKKGRKGTGRAVAGRSQGRNSCDLATPYSCPNLFDARKKSKVLNNVASTMPHTHLGLLTFSPKLQQ